MGSNTCNYVGYSYSSYAGTASDPILRWSGDNTGSNGFESALFDVKAFKVFYPNINEFIIDCRSHWYVTPGSSPVRLGVKLYKGGTIGNTNNYQFVINDFTQIYSFSTASTAITTAYSGSNKSPQRVATFKYNLITKEGIIDNTDTTTPVGCY
jgi:hypothetical protein